MESGGGGQLVCGRARHSRRLPQRDRWKGERGREMRQREGEVWGRGVGGLRGDKGIWRKEEETDRKTDRDREARGR